MVVIVLIFNEPPYRSPQWLHQFIFPPTVYWDSLSSHPCRHMLFLVFLMIAILTGVVWSSLLKDNFSRYRIPDWSFCLSIQNHFTQLSSCLHDLWEDCCNFYPFSSMSNPYPSTPWSDFFQDFGVLEFDYDVSRYSFVLCGIVLSFLLFFELLGSIVCCH